MTQRTRRLQAITRRHFFRQAGFGIGTAALSSLMRPDFPSSAAAAEVESRKPHFAPRAKNVIYLFMAGAPSQVDLLDYKPKLGALDGTNVPEEVVKGERFAFIRGTPKLLGSPYK